MKLGVSTACLYPELTEIALENVVNNKACSYCENITEIFLNTYSETKVSFAKELRKMADDKSMQVVSVHPFTSKEETKLFFSEYHKRRFDDGLEQYKMYYNFANEMGAKLVVLHGCFLNQDIEDKEYFERFAIMREDARKYGITLAQENVNGYKSQEVQFIKDMKAYLNGNVEFVFDVKQTVRAKQDSFAMLDTMGENIVHLHLSDNIVGQNSCLPIGRGNFDFYKMFDKLKKLNYNKTGVLELYRHNYGDYSELYQSIAKLDRIIKNVYEGESI